MANHPALKAADFNIDAPKNLIYLPKEVDIHPTRSIHLRNNTRQSLRKGSIKYYVL